MRAADYWHRGVSYERHSLNDHKCSPTAGAAGQQDAKGRSAAAKNNSGSKKNTATKVRLDLPDSYLDIELEEAVGYRGDIEVPCYENVRLSRAVPHTTNMLRPL